MHKHDDNKQGGGNGMMWMMVICCALLLGVLFLSGSALSAGTLSGYFWPVLIGIFVIAHIWMMFKGHGGNNTEDKANDALTKESGAKDEHKHSGCCH